MKSHSEILIPHHSEHLWRYTPWKRMHPTEPHDVPESRQMSITGAELIPSELPASEEISRSLLHEMSKGEELVIANECMTIDVKASGHITASSLKIVAKGHAQLMIRLVGEAGWVGLRIHGEVLSGGCLSVGFVNQLTSDSVFLRSEDWVIHRDARIEHATLSGGGLTCKSDIRINLADKGSECAVGAAIYGSEKRHDDHHFEIHHASPNTNSTLVSHAACDGASRSIGTGMLTIDEQCHQSDANQVFRNLLLSEKARAESIPELEVLADDVKAGHGAASAPVNPSQIHYLMSRGMNHEEAVALIAEGFLIDAFREIRNKEVVAFLRDELTLHLQCLVI